MSQFIVTYIAFALLTGYLGRHSSLGFWKTTLMSVFLTPVITFIVLFLFFAVDAESRAARRETHQAPR